MSAGPKSSQGEPAVFERFDAPCALCGSERAEVRYRIGGFRVERCRQCGLAAITPRLPEEAAAALYEAIYSGDAPARVGDAETRYAGCVADAERRRARGSRPDCLDRRRLAALESLAPGRRLLDVGASAGFFLEDARARGWEVSGIEASQWAVDRATARGIPVAVGTVRSSEREPGSFDAVTLWNVLEHLHDPVRDLGKIRRWLRPGGILALSTPNYDSVVRLARGARWHGFKLDEHLSLFSPQTIGFLLEETGYEPLHLATTATELVRARGWFPAVHGILRLSAAAVNETLGRVLFYPWEKGLRGDMMEVYARRYSPGDA